MSIYVQVWYDHKRTYYSYTISLSAIRLLACTDLRSSTAVGPFFLFGLQTAYFSAAALVFQLLLKMSAEMLSYSVLTYHRRNIIPQRCFRGFQRHRQPRRAAAATAAAAAAAAAVSPACVSKT